MRAQGFTTSELMMVVAISGILMAFALPGFRTMTLDTRRTVALDALMTSFSLARAEAQKRGSTIAVCPLDAAGAACAGGSNWSAGWMVFVDPNGNGVRDNGEPAPLDKFVPDDASRRRITATTYGATTGFVLVQAFNQGATAATITVCDARGASGARAVTVSSTGRGESSAKDLNYAALSCP